MWSGANVANCDDRVVAAANRIAQPVAVAGADSDACAHSDAADAADAVTRAYPAAASDTTAGAAGRVAWNGEDD